MLATAMLSRLLCPGTPSKVSAGVAPADLAFAIPLGFSGVGSTVCPSLRDAARVMRGATVGGAVDATVMVSERLWPGTPANVFAMDSGVAGCRFGETAGSTVPMRRAAARDMRGTMSGLS